MRGRTMPTHMNNAAKRLRREMTEAEKRLWSRLRGHRLSGVSFRRQAVLGPYIVDFLCPRVKLIVEVDGSQHTESAEDQKRDAFLAGHGYEVRRYWNNEVLGNLDAVLEDLYHHIAARIGTPSLTLPPAGGGNARDKRLPVDCTPSPGPSPQRGEGNSAGPAQTLRYERDPHAIYRQSFATVEAEARLDHLPDDLRPVAIRLVHACGMVDVPNRLAWSDEVGASARAALAAGAPVLCDCEMAASGIVRGKLPAGNPVLCTLNAPEVPELAERIGNTRSAAAVELWRERLEGAVVVIGNAPTALFHLLELLDLGWPKPAAILGFPVGFVGAAESKAELARNPRGVPFLTLRGRRGGSSMAAAALNGLAAGLEPPR